MGVAAKKSLEGAAGREKEAKSLLTNVFREKDICRKPTKTDEKRPTTDM
jgi:hypothetical protein